MQSDQKSIRRNSIIYMVRSFMNIMFPLITFKYASNVIKATGIGAANFSSAVISYVGLISSLGISSYAVSEGSKIRKKRNELGGFVGELFTINLFSMLFSYFVLAILLLTVRQFKPYCLLIIIYSSTIFFNALGLEWFFNIEEKFVYITIRSIIIQVLSLVLLLFFVKSENDTPWYVMLTAVSSAGSCLLNFFYAKKSMYFKLAPLCTCKKHIKPILVIWASNVASLIYINADTIIIGLINGDKSVGYYSVAVKIIKAICIPIASIGVVAGPQLSEALANNKKEKINKLFKQVIDFISFFVFPCIVGLTVWGKESILLISGKEFLSALTVERILLVDIILSPLNGFIINQIMIPIRQEKKAMYVMIIAAVSNIILDLILLPQIGIVGAAIATVISEMLVLFASLPFVGKVVNFGIVFKDVWKYAISCFVIIPFFYISKIIFTNTIMINLFVMLTYIMLYCLLVCIFFHKNIVSLFRNTK